MFRFTNHRQQRLYDELYGLSFNYQLARRVNVPALSIFSDTLLPPSY